MRLELSRKAQADLDDIRDYGIEQFGVLRAIAYLDEIEQAFRRIVAYPEIGAASTIGARRVRSLACQRHRIFYRVQAETVLIGRVLHSAMDPARHL